MKLSRTEALTILKTLPKNLSDPHPYAVEGNLKDFKRANDRHRGSTIHHYFMRNTLFYTRDNATPSN